MTDKVVNYFKKHPEYNSIVHVIGGVGVGILITYPLVGSHPVRWGVLLLLISILGHLYPLLKK